MTNNILNLTLRNRLKLTGNFKGLTVFHKTRPLTGKILDLEVHNIYPPCRKTSGFSPRI